MRLFLPILILFLVASTEAPAQQSYATYHTTINQAEQEIIQGHTDAALRLYRTAFAQYDFIFSKDALSAAQIAVRHGRPALADSFLLKGAASGLSPDCLDAIPILCDLIHNPAKRGLRQRMTDSSLRFARTRNTALAKDWRRRYQEEQAAKNARAGFVSFRDIVRQNVAFIVVLWNERHIYPGDQVIGLPDCNSRANTWAFYSLAHYDCSASTFQDMLWGAVEAGMLHPREFAALWGFERLLAKNVSSNRRTNPACTPLIKRFSHAWLIEEDSSSLAEVAENRARYWLCPVETDRALHALERTEGYRFRFNYR